MTGKIPTRMTGGCLLGTWNQRKKTLTVKGLTEQAQTPMFADLEGCVAGI